MVCTFVSSMKPAATTLTLSTKSTTTSSQMADATIESAFEAAIASGKIKGAVICAYDATDNFVYERALGERTLLSGEKRPQQLDDMLCLASTTKLFATIALLQCVEDGLVTLTDDISHLIPELPANQVLPSDPNSPLQPVTSPITLQMLLTHTHGQPYHFLAPRLGAWKAQHDPSTQSGVPRRRPVESFFSHPLAFHPATSWLYGSGLDWAGLLLQRLTHSTLGDHIRRRICIPLGIPPDDAQFYPVQGEAVRSRLVDLSPEDPEAVGRAVFGDGMENPNRGGEGDFGGHGMFSTGEAYGRVMRSLLRGDGLLLRKETVEEMFRDWIGGSEAEGGFLAVMESPAGAFFRMGIEPGVRVGYGLGALVTLEDIEGAYGKGTLTWGGAASMMWFIDRKNGICGFVAIQPSLPIDMATLKELKTTFRYDVYRKFVAWKGGQEKA